MRIERRLQKRREALSEDRASRIGGHPVIRWRMSFVGGPEVHFAGTCATA
jgi:hypothetical protein